MQLSFYAETKEEAERFAQMVRAAGAHITDVGDFYDGVALEIKATEKQLERLNKARQNWNKNI